MRKGDNGGEKKEKNGENSGHYVVASRPPDGDRLQRRRWCQKQAGAELGQAQLKLALFAL